MLPDIRQPSPAYMRSTIAGRGRKSGGERGLEGLWPRSFLASGEEKDVKAGAAVALIIAGRTEAVR
jgi:hypothetical protein